MDAHYRDEPDGLPGNDDGGTLSAWWVFAALGLYPIAGTDAYVLSAPRFARAEIDVPGGVFAIVAEGEGETIGAIDLDGTPVSGRDLRHAELRPGSVLRFVRGR
jgi:putative alpha-1,2-mannosidase